MEEEKKRIYPSLPISGYDIDERRAAAEQKEKRGNNIKKTGYGK